MSGHEIDLLRPVSASMGMMLETISRRLTKRGQAHFACPDKVPIQRLRTLRRAGKKSVPFTTGLLIGIGESFEERIEALHVINSAHQEFGHIQEVIIQNFQRKPDIEMADHPEPTLKDMLRTIAVARIILDPSISLQAPPNLSDRHMNYLQAGINDWGGVSPITIDHVNPESPWPQIEQLEKITKDSKVYGTTGDDFDPALLTDGLKAEREQGITIDVAYRYFSTDKRKFIIADWPS